MTDDKIAPSADTALSASPRDARKHPNHPVPRTPAPPTVITMATNDSTPPHEADHAGGNDEAGQRERLASEAVTWHMDTVFKR